MTNQFFEKPILNLLVDAHAHYKALKKALMAEINEEAWATQHSDTLRAFDKPKLGRIAVECINRLGGEVMKVFKVGQDPI